MRPDLPWNVAGVPPEAREAARAAARREGLSVGEWLTRKILRSLTETHSTFESDAPSGDWMEPAADPTSLRHDRGEALTRPQRPEFDAEGACRRIDDELRNLTRRIDATERSQAESHRAMNKSAAEMTVASREHVRVVDELSASVTSLSRRIERVERQAPGDGLRDAVRGLHQGLTRLADQLSRATSHSADQVSALTDRLEEIAEGLAQTKLDTDSLTRRTEGRTAQIDERMHAVERRIETMASDAARAAENALAVARLEESLARVEARPPDPALDRRLHGIERAIADVTDRTPIPDPRSLVVEDQIRALGERIESSEKHQRDLVSELRLAIAAIPRAEPHDRPLVVPKSDDHSATIAETAGVAARDQPTTVSSPADDLPTISDDIGSPPPPSDGFPHNAPKPSETPEAIVRSLTPVEPAPSRTEEQAPVPALNEPLSPLHDSFLAAARRSAQVAAAQVEAERASRGFGGFAWNTRAEPARRKSPRYGIVGLLALGILLLAAAGILFSHRFAPVTNGGPTKLADKGARALTRNAGARSSPIARTGVVNRPASNSQTATAGTQGLNAAPVPVKPEHLAVADIHGAAAGGGPNAKQTGTAPASAHAGPSVAALDRLTALANLGNAKAETIVGLRYLDGDGIAPNESEAAKWLARAAAHGEAVAQYRLGTLYEHGRGVPADTAKALHWYEAAAQAGNRKAMHNLAVAYAQGTGVPKDFFEAARWFSKAAALGLADSQFNLAVLYERGLGVPQSLIDAYKWYAIAAAQGDGESKARIDAITTQLSADERAAAQRSADQFKPAQLNAAANVPPQLNDIAG